MKEPRIQFHEEDLQYIVEKGKKKAVILKLEDFKNLMKIVSAGIEQYQDGAQALFDVILKMEKQFTDKGEKSSDVSSHYKDYLYGKDGIVK
ncbi:MAG: hypothetical protein ACE5JB_16235 [bacterium]